MGKQPDKIGSELITYSDRHTGETNVALFFDDFILLPVLSRTQSGGIFEKAAEGGLVFKTQHQGNLFGAFG